MPVGPDRVVGGASRRKEVGSGTKEVQRKESPGRAVAAGGRLAGCHVVEVVHLDWLDGTGAAGGTDRWKFFRDPRDGPACSSRNQPSFLQIHSSVPRQRGRSVGDSRVRSFGTAHRFFQIFCSIGRRAPSKQVFPEDRVPSRRGQALLTCCLEGASDAELE